MATRSRRFAGTPTSACPSGHTITVSVRSIPHLLSREAKNLREKDLLSERSGERLMAFHALQLRELLRTKVLAFEPDQVTYVMCLNDFDFTESSGRKIGYFRKPRSFLALEIEQRYRRLRAA